MKKLKTSGCLFLKSDNISGNRNNIANTIFMMVIAMNKLNMSFFPEEYL
ncbi:hypothetical protein [Winogradskyella sp.]